MGSYNAYFIAYILGGVTFLPLVLALILLHAYLTLPHHETRTSAQYDTIRDSRDDPQTIKSSRSAVSLAEKFKRGHEADVAAGYFAVCREYVPGGINGKPPERTTPAGAVVATESPSVYQSMYRSIFDRKQGPSIDSGKANGKTTKRARNVFFVVLRHGHLMLYDDSEQLEVRHVISLGHYDVSIYGEGENIPEGELWIKRNAICLNRKPNVGDTTSTSKPFYLFSENCSDKEDFYFALLHNQEVKPGAQDNPPRPRRFDTKHIIMLVQKLHSSEEQLQTRWVNGLVGRLFLALYKTRDIENYIRKKITKKIARVKKPAFLSDIVLQKIDLGESAPHITNPRLKDLTVDGDCSAEADFKYSGNFRLQIAATARIDLGSRFKAREVHLVLAVVLRKMEGHVLIKFKPPPSNRVWISFETMPDMEMSIEPIVSSRQITYNFILRAIESRIREVIAETLVLPHWDDSPFTDTSDQRFRGGIWANEGSDDIASMAHTPVPDEAVEDEIEDLRPATDEPSPITHRSEDDKTMSMPVLAETTPTNLSLRNAKHVKPISALDGSTDGAVSTGVQKEPTPPKAMRSHSFATVANPLVSMDNANVKSTKSETRRKQQHDATSAMKAISDRSRPTSPIGVPSVSQQISPTLWRNSQTSSLSSSSSAANSILEQTVTQSMIASPNPSSAPVTPTSIGSRSIESFPKGDVHPPNNLSSAALPGSAADKIHPAAAPSAAIAAAKRWGWSVLTRTNDQKNGTDPDRAGTPDNPIGRGRPLPPPGMPLPPPERPSSKASPISLPKRKAVAPPLLPQRRQDDSKLRAVPAPPLPTRRRQKSTAISDSDEQGVLVVEAPSDSEASTSLDEVEKDFSGPKKSEHEHPASIDRKAGLSPGKHNSVHSRESSQSFSRSYDAEDAMSSWQFAQEEEARSKSIWQDDNEH